MKTANMLMTMIVVLTNATAAFAAPAREDNSGIIVWAFLGFCALIVIAQVIPAILMMIGAARGFLPEKKAEEAN